jgi:hypothetical protein
MSRRHDEWREIVINAGCDVMLSPPETKVQQMNDVELVSGSPFRLLAANTKSESCTRLPGGGGSNMDSGIVSDKRRYLPTPHTGSVSGKKKETARQTSGDNVRFADRIVAVRLWVLSTTGCCGNLVGA